MKNLFFTLSMLLVSFTATSQIQFEKGYLITNDSSRIECLIRNVDWENNPTSFRYKLINDENILTGNVADIKEFAVENGPVYIRHKVKIDASAVDPDIISRQRNPVWNEEEVFLKLVNRGTVWLLLYKKNKFRQFYYQKNGQAPEALIYKRYYDDNGVVTVNAAYGQQLWNELKCKAISLEYVSRVNYTESDISRFFEKYNVCKDKNYLAPEKVKGRDAFSLKLTPGIDLTHVKTNDYTTVDAGDAQNFSFRMGLEAEYVAPFNRNKWALLIEPSYQYYNVNFNLASLKLNMNFWSLDIPMGLRHYFFLPGGSKIFVNGLYVTSIYNKQTKKARENRAMEIGTGSNAAFGAGFAKGRISAEVRYGLKRYLDNDFIKANADYSKLSLILGYKIFAN